MNVFAYLDLLLTKNILYIVVYKEKNNLMNNSKIQI